MAESVVIPQPPDPGDEQTRRRWEHTRLRRRMLYGHWEEDLRARARLLIGHVRTKAWGALDLSANVYRSVMGQLAVLYDDVPGHEADGDVAELAALVRASGLWQLQGRTQRDCLGMREIFVVPAVLMGRGGMPELAYRPAFADLVKASAHPDRPDEPTLFREAVLREKPNGDLRWTWDVLDVRDAGRPVWQVIDANSSMDISAETLLDEEGRPAPAGGFAGDRYPFRWDGGNGAPFMPAQAYHASKTGTLFDPYEGRELIEGTLQVALLWSLFAHGVRAASWPQRWMLNARVSGSQLEGEDEQAERKAVTTDPAMALELEVIDSAEGQAMIGQWQPGCDPNILQEAISAYERRLAGFAGLSPADFHRVSGDPRSGYALAVSREAQREAQRRFAPQFSEGDQKLLAKTAAMLNRATGSKIPETGHRMIYKSLPPSAEEQKAQREHILALIAAGLMDRVQGYIALNPGTTREAAQLALDDIRTVNARYSAAA